ncbi:hypothetical protein BN7_6589 [Wickerhamomyces ciferrii]|uniref:Uncharacterized protein n=1 Tax=Wickerhamomyces ciferrii (strain ATCC 14091 / BCRC 22168 / CBS 111 / JCM 3599 / NBRC 0793 / NRRL Y-1031 F-60-10) TaxID=1206466 RepID=K0KY29_WICCF|nr:uncharacterized protein BN7_6589 [Wickerhamomyces ciferrii]CCH46982.1 hypothetical protein BN7_6589 [Wickerhamomyces ciferrii]
MALRNYMYYKHEDELKDKIAHGLTSSTLTNSTPRIIDSSINIINKAKKLTPTQIKKLERLKLEEEYRRNDDDDKENQEHK